MFIEIYNYTKKQFYSSIWKFVRWKFGNDFIESSK